MAKSQKCPECGAIWAGDETCVDHFYLLEAWELENRLYDVHHLMVLCYYLQHPSLYSPEGLRDAKRLLVMFLEEGASPQQVRQRMHNAVDSSARTYKITGTPESHGEYTHPIQWTMTAADVVVAGIESYYDSVATWADSVLKALRLSQNLM